MRKLGRAVFAMAFAFAATIWVGSGHTALARNDGPDFNKLLKVTAPKPKKNTEAESGKTREEKQYEYYKKIEEAREKASKSVRNYDPELHGFVAYGKLRCEKNYMKSPEGDRCVPVPEVDGGRWTGEYLFCHDGYLKLNYADGKQTCQKLPEIENGYYKNKQIVCLAGYAPVNKECVPVEEIPDIKLVKYKYNLCPDGFDMRLGDCYEREKPVQIEQGYHVDVVDDDKPAKDINLNPYETIE